MEETGDGLPMQPRQSSWSILPRSRSRIDRSEPSDKAMKTFGHISKQCGSQESALFEISDRLMGHVKALGYHKGRTHG